MSEYPFIFDKSSKKIRCPKCGDNLLTQDDYINAQAIHTAIDVMNGLSPELIKEISENINIDDIKNSLKEIGITKIAVPIHYLICDKDGTYLVVEYVNNELRYYASKECPIPVLENELYEKSLKYLKEESIDFECDSRFSTAAYCISNISKDCNNQDLIRQGFSILDIIKQDYYTKWKIPWISLMCFRRN
mgnify:CR=1 FL=1